MGNFLIFGFDDPCEFFSAPNILLFCNTMIMNNNSKLHYALGSVAALITLNPCWLHCRRVRTRHSFFSKPWTHPGRSLERKIQLTFVSFLCSTSLFLFSKMKFQGVGHCYPKCYCWHCQHHLQLSFCKKALQFFLTFHDARKPSEQTWKQHNFTNSEDVRACENNREDSSSRIPLGSSLQPACLTERIKNK